MKRLITITYTCNEGKSVQEGSIMAGALGILNKAGADDICIQSGQVPEFRQAKFLDEAKEISIPSFLYDRGKRGVV